MFQFSNFVCHECKILKDIKIDISEHVEKISKSANGLVSYSDLHECSLGIIGVTNLLLDANYTIRGIEYCKFASAREKSVKSILEIPVPTKQSITKIKLSSLDSTKSFRLLIENTSLLYNINIGDVSADEEPLHVFKSPFHSTTIQYYKSNTEFTSEVVLWFENLVQMLEFLPPPKLGLLFEALFYIKAFQVKKPSQIDLNLLKLIFVPHEIFFKIDEEPIGQSVFDKLTIYSEQDREIMHNIYTDFKEKPNNSLLDHANHQRNFITITFYSLLMENENLIKIIRPGIIEKEFELDSVLSQYM